MLLVLIFFFALSDPKLVFALIYVCVGWKLKVHINGPERYWWEMLN